MNRLTSVLALLVGLVVVLAGCDASEGPRSAGQGGSAASAGVHRFSAESIDGRPVDLASYRGSVLLIVNVASKCGNTPQYADLQRLYDEYRGAGLVVLGFPANDFRGQEPGSNEDILLFCQDRYGVTFPMFAKISVVGPDKHPLYAWLTDAEVHPQTGGEVEWNFAKFLVGRDGQVVARFKPKTKPYDEQVIQALQAALADGQR